MVNKADIYELEKVSIRVIRDPEQPYKSSIPLNSPERVVRFLHDEIFADLDREIFAVVNLKTDLSFTGMKVLADSDPTRSEGQGIQPLSFNVCSMGALSESLVHPREVLKSSILQNAGAVMLVHNHPSGNLQPSPEDINITDRLIKAYDLIGIPVKDHIILGPNEQYFSFFEKGILSLPQNHYERDIDKITFTSPEPSDNGGAGKKGTSVIGKLQAAKKEASKPTEGKETAPATEKRKQSRKRIQKESI